MNRLTRALCGVALLLSPGPSLAQDSGAMAGMDQAAMAGAMGRMMTVMEDMMQAMPRQSSGNVDADFLLMMIPHHQSAIEMARIELAEGADEESRAMAQAIIAAQEQEIAQMRDMLKRLGVEPPPAGQ